MDEVNEKLVSAKEKLAAQRSAKGQGTGEGDASRDRLPPGQRLVTDGWPVLDLGKRPDIRREEWTLEVSGLATPKTFDWDSFAALPQSELTTDFHCVTTWSIFDAQVTGVLWADFMAAIDVPESATHVLFHAYDGYTTNVSMAELAQPDVAIVHSFAGEPLTREHGGPVRMWVPQLYAWKSAKWVKGIEFLDADAKGFWEKRGYHNHGDPWKEERYS